MYENLPLNFDNIASVYMSVFGSYPPVIANVEPNNVTYLEILRNAIINNKSVTRDELLLHFANGKFNQ